MISPFIGYGIIIIFMVWLLLLLLIIRGSDRKTIKSYILAGKQIPFSFMAPSIFVSWIWCTTILGAAEAGLWYGISGGWAYSFGASLAFFVLVIFILKLRKLMPRALSMVEFLGERYGNLIKDIFYLLCVLVVIYITIEQAVGIGIVFHNIFGISFKISAFTAVMIACAFTILGGMKGVIYNDIVQFFIISLSFIALTTMIIKIFPLDFIYSGLLDAKNNIANNNYNVSILSVTSKTGIMYAVSAVIIALGQIFMDPGYFTKACAAKSIKTIKSSFIIGGIILWIPVPIISAFVFGYSAIGLKLDIQKSFVLADNALLNYFDNRIEIILAILIFSIGITTITNSMLGIQAIFTADYYKRKLVKTASEIQQIRFGKVVTVWIGFLCALIAISLDGISLLKIDIFSGIFFAAPCGTLIFGIFSSKSTQNQAIVSIVLGLTFGMGAWLIVKDQNMNWFYGILLSFIIPIIYIFITSSFNKKEFNFNRLKFYK